MQSQGKNYGQIESGTTGSVGFLKSCLIILSNY